MVFLLKLDPLRALATSQEARGSSGDAATLVDRDTKVIYRKLVEAYEGGGLMSRFQERFSKPTATHISEKEFLKFMSDALDAPDWILQDMFDFLIDETHLARYDIFLTYFMILASVSLNTMKEFLDRFGDSVFNMVCGQSLQNESLQKLEFLNFITFVHTLGINTRSAYSLITREDLDVDAPFFITQMDFIGYLTDIINEERKQASNKSGYSYSQSSPTCCTIL